MREITTHRVHGLNDALTITVLDAPGAGNACHEYMVTYGPGPADMQMIGFQQGLISVAGVNGISNEALLAIVRDRLECFQAGDYACEENEEALDCVTHAMEKLAARTRGRLARGVEDTHQP